MLIQSMFIVIWLIIAIIISIDPVSYAEPFIGCTFDYLDTAFIIGKDNLYYVFFNEIVYSGGYRVNNHRVNIHSRNNIVYLFTNQTSGQLFVSSYTNNDEEPVVEIIVGESKGIYKRSFCEYKLKDKKFAFLFSAKHLNGSQYPYLAKLTEVDKESVRMTSVPCTSSRWDCRLMSYKDHSGRQLIKLYDNNFQLRGETQLDKSINTMLVISRQLSDSNVLTVQLYLMFQIEKVNALYELKSTGANLVVNRISLFKQNGHWIDCQPDLCLNAYINAIVLKNYIFSGNYYWHWNVLTDEFTKYQNKTFINYIKQVNYRNMETAFIDPRNGRHCAVRFNKVMNLQDIESDNQNLDDKQPIGQVFPGHNYSVNAILCDQIDRYCYLFSGKIFKLYNLSDNKTDKFVLKEKGQMKQLGLPNDLDTAFIDENGDKIYIKGNYLFWREYGVIRKLIVQKYLRCPHNYYENLKVSEINSWQKFTKDIETYELIDFTEQHFPLIPSTVDINDDNVNIIETTTHLPNNNTITTKNIDLSNRWTIIIALIIASICAILVFISLLIWFIIRHLSTSDESTLKSERQKYLKEKFAKLKNKKH